MLGEESNKNESKKLPLTIVYTTVFVPFLCGMMVLECTVLDRTLLARLMRSFEFWYIIASTFLFQWPSQIDRVLQHDDPSSLVLSVTGYFSPIIGVWFCVHDASVHRPRGTTIAAVFVSLVVNVVSLYQGEYGVSSTGDSSSKMICIASHCLGTIYITIRRPALMNLIIFYLKYLWLLIAREHHNLLLATPLAKTEVIHADDAGLHDETDNELIVHRRYQSF